MSDFIKIGRTNVHFAEFGDARPSRGTVVLLHGFSCDHRMMTGAFEPLLAPRDGWRRVYLDLPGHGQTKAGPEIDSTNAVLDVVAEAVARLVPEGPLALAGESYGGYLSQGLIAREPQRYAGACLIAPCAVAEHARRVVPDAAVLVRDESVVVDLTPEQRQELDEFCVVQDARVMQRTREEIDPGTAIGDQAALERIQSGYIGSFESQPAPTFAPPSLMITGRQDSIVGYVDQWALLENFPRMTYAVLDRAGHNVHIEQDVLFNALVTEWVDRVEESLA